MHQTFNIREANPSDTNACAAIHQQEIATGFISQLGIRFLELLYEAMIKSNEVICFVLTENEGSVVGFISGCPYVGKFYKEFFFKYWLKAFLVLLPKIIKISILKKIIETGKYSSKEDINANKLPDAELLAIAVKPDARGSGWSQKLTEALFAEFRKRGVGEIKVVVGADNIQANRFYNKMGFKLFMETSVHKSEVSNVYVKTLSIHD